VTDRTIRSKTEKAFSIAGVHSTLLLLSGLMLLVGLYSVIIGVIGEMLTRYQIEEGPKPSTTQKNCLAAKIGVGFHF
jgi:hypothetical protein